MRRALLLLLALAGCSSTNDIINMQPQLACPSGVECRVFEWQLGFRVGFKIGGSHVSCHCVDTS